ncbi:B3 domain-containing transcription factor VRN1-like [Corylus avellana]|uniref:B3 domain-containing transcription factor VRN1-like n=1 Tax=Corylus avellana TaxID=13451 RepID=UPI00286BA433|nr:B3 domain-containing transcription factor VRN1-like [Corylus avellana]
MAERRRGISTVGSNQTTIVIRLFLLYMARTRRTRVVPNRSYYHRPSSSMAGRRPSHFFKVILPSTIHDKKLKIPVKFVMEFGDDLSDVATLTVPNGHSWKVGLEKPNGEIWFHDGWKEFMEYHSIHYGYFLVFRYEGNSKFHVLVFDNTATEIQYPWREDCELEDPVDIIDLDDATKSRQEMSHSDELSAKHEENIETFVGKRFSGGSSSEGRERAIQAGRERAIQAARMLKPTCPSFMAISRHMHRYNLYVPAKFAVKYLSGHAFVKLQNSDGKQWDARCYDHDHPNSAKNIGKGWTQFCIDNNLQRGDVCVLELINKNPIVLNVSIFHVADY